MFELYEERESWAHAADPRVKMLFALLGATAMLVSKEVAVFAGGLIVSHALIFRAGISLRRVMWVWKTMLPINLLIPVMWLLFQPRGDAFLEVGILRLTTGAIWGGVSMALRLDAIAFFVFAWLFTTDQGAIVRGLVRLGLPFEWGLTLAIALRYIPTFYGLYLSVYEAQQARGLDLSRGGLLLRLRAYLPILGAMVIEALRMSDNLSRALEARALGTPGIRRTHRVEPRFRTPDYLYTALLFSAFTCVVLWHFRGAL